MFPVTAGGCCCGEVSITFTVQTSGGAFPTPPFILSIPEGSSPNGTIFDFEQEAVLLLGDGLFMRYSATFPFEPGTWIVKLWYGLSLEGRDFTAWLRFVLSNVQTCE